MHRAPYKLLRLTPTNKNYRKTLGFVVSDVSLGGQQEFFLFFCVFTRVFCRNNTNLYNSVVSVDKFTYFEYLLYTFSVYGPNKFFSILLRTRTIRFVRRIGQRWTAVARLIFFLVIILMFTHRFLSKRIKINSNFKISVVSFYTT